MKVLRINSALIKTLRNQKLWSQDDLATACGVSLRTIQRVEGEGQVSVETLRSLVSTFEVDSDFLQIDSSYTNGYLNLQLEIALICIFLVIELLLVLSFAQDTMNGAAFAGLSSLIGLICCFFSTLTTKVSASEVEWYFTFGFLKKTVQLGSIISTNAVRNKAWWGLGIRLLPQGWLYCISGLDVVELVLDDGSRIRVGTDEPREFNSAINYARTGRRRTLF